MYVGTVLCVLCVLGAAQSRGNSSDVEAPCGLEPGPWAAALELWATSDHGDNTRQGRIMALPPAQGYYVTDRIDLMPPPPPPHRLQHLTQGSAPHHHNSGPQHHMQAGSLQHQGPQQHAQAGPPQPPGPPHHTQTGPPQPPRRHYEEWQATPPPPPSTGKIVNRPPNPYGDKFRPSYGVSGAGQPIPVQGAADRVDPGPGGPGGAGGHKQVSETDLFLLSAMEKLVYRADLMEKRLRKLEEALHRLVASAATTSATTTAPVNKPDPCASDFTRVGSWCYFLSGEALNWKGASVACRRRAASLLELDAAGEKRIFHSALLAQNELKGVDWWTGGLNPGLLWIWSHSARPVNETSTPDASLDTNTVVGAGRCLALVHDPTTASYVYRGQDCGLKHRYVCEAHEDKNKLSNEVERIAKMIKGRFVADVENDVTL